MRLNKTSIILIIIAAAALVALAVYFLRPQGTVEFILAPQNVTLAMKNTKLKAIQHKQTMSLTPGAYDATFSAAGFRSETTRIIVRKGEKTRLIMALTPETEAAKKLLSENSESQQVIKEYKEVKYKELLNTLPLSGSNYSIASCSSVKYPNESKEALCINTSFDGGVKNAKDRLVKNGYDINDLEFITIDGNIQTIIKKDNYQIDYYANAASDDSSKLSLFITPLNVPYVPFNTPNDPQLETIKANALKDLESSGYKLNNYNIYYSNIYLSRYNPSANEPSDHAVAPVN
jgi:hypothetical protein